MNIDSNNHLINTFSERVVAKIAALPKHAIADTAAKGLDMGDVILAIRNETTHERYQRPIRSFYDLSTAHVSPEARHWLEAQAWANQNPTTGIEGVSHPVAAFRSGWVFYVPSERHWDDSIPADLHDACVEARMCGCDYILFDADAEIIGTLPVWLDDETSVEGLTEEEQKALASIHPEDGLPMDDPHKPADRRVLVDDESPTFGRARRAAQEAGKAALEEDEK